MLDILRAHLQQTETPAFFAAIEEANDLLARFDYPGYEDQYEMVFARFDALESPSRAIYDLTLSMQVTVLRLHGIVLDESSDQVKVEFLNKVMQVILRFEDTELFREIEEVVVNIDDPIERVATLFNVMDSTIDIETFTSIIADVVHALPRKILEVARKNHLQHVVPQEERITPEYQEFVARAVLVLGPTHVLERAKGSAILITFDEYGKYLDEMLPEDITKINIPAYARELLTAAIVSNSGEGNYIGVVKAFMAEQTEFSLEQHTKILVEVEQLSTKIGNKPSLTTTTP